MVQGSTAGDGVPDGTGTGRRTAGERPVGSAYNLSVNVTLSTAEALRAALAGLLDGLPPKQAAQAVDRLIANYRGTTPTDAPVLRDRSDVAAYAAYRMPATFEAVRSALAALARGRPGVGTRHATWTSAAAPARRAGPSPGPGRAHRTTVLDWAEPALALGRELAAASGVEALRAAEWRRARIGAALELDDHGSGDRLATSWGS